jgi:hypothetical protein
MLSEGTDIPLTVHRALLAWPAYAIGLPEGVVEQLDAAAGASRGYAAAGGWPGGEAPPDPLLIAMLRSLPRRQREVVVLRVLLDLDTATTASQLGMAQGTVKVQLSRALATLRERLVSQVHFEVEEYSRDR